jgi:hypothetical protein
VLEAAFPWIPAIIVAGAVVMGDRILNMFLLVEQSKALVSLAGMLAVLVIVLVTLCYLKTRQGGDDGEED